MNPKDYRYTSNHEWIKIEPYDHATIGLTAYAQSKLGTIVFLDLSIPDTEFEKSQKIGDIESRKAVSELIAPVSGKILRVNEEAVNNPEIVNKDPYQKGWLVQLLLSKPSELSALMTSEEYDKFELKLIQDEKPQC
jgi:glycine cleavage system H protein